MLDYLPGMRPNFATKVLMLLCALAPMSCGAFADAVDGSGSSATLSFDPSSLNAGDKKVVHIVLSKDPPWGSNSAAYLTRLDLGQGIGYSHADYDGSRTVVATLQASPNADPGARTVTVGVAYDVQSFSGSGTFWVVPSGHSDGGLDGEDQ